jgi:transcriptional regulator with XRE-family HTH domain
MENESDFIRELGKKIRFQREKASLSLNDLSRITNIKIEAIIAYENGTRSIRIEDFLKIVKALEIDTSQLIDGIVS